MNIIRDDGAIAIATALQTNKNSALTTLDISRNEIGDAGAKAIETALKENTTLKELNIFYNNIGIEIENTNKN